MHDMGEEMNMIEAKPMRTKKKKGEKEVYYRREYISAKKMPELKGKDIGDKVVLMQYGEVVGVEIRKNNDGKESEEYIIEIQKGMVHDVAKEEKGDKMSKQEKIAETFKGGKKMEEEDEDY